MRLRCRFPPIWTTASSIRTSGTPFWRKATCPISDAQQILGSCRRWLKPGTSSAACALGGGHYPRSSSLQGSSKAMLDLPSFNHCPNIRAAPTIILPQKYVHWGLCERLFRQGPPVLLPRERWSAGPAPTLLPASRRPSSVNPMEVYNRLIPGASLSLPTLARKFTVTGSCGGLVCTCLNTVGIVAVCESCKCAYN